jgi:integrase
MARLLEVKKAKVEDRYIERDKNLMVTLDQLFDWFIALQEVQKLDSYSRMKVQLKALRRLLTPQQVIRDLSIAQLENFVHKRLQEPSPNRIGKTIAPKTVKEEISLLRNILNRALRHEIISKIPVAYFPSVKVDNVRKRIFTDDEYQRLLEACPLWLCRIVIMAYWTGMRQREIIQLEWNAVDLKTGFIRLKAAQTKTDEARSVRLSPQVIQMMKEIPRTLHTRNVFLSVTQKPIRRWGSYQKKVWNESLKRAGIKDAVFHDLRHDFVTKAMRRGNPAYLVMKQVGHKSDAMLRRYQLIDERDLFEFRFSSESQKLNETS